MKRLSWDSMRIATLRCQQRGIQNQAIDAWHGKLLLQKAILSFKLVTHDQKRMQNVSKIVSLSNKTATKEQYFQMFKEGVQISKKSSILKKKSETFFE